MKKGMIDSALISSLFFATDFAGAEMASGGGDDERYERGENVMSAVGVGNGSMIVIKIGMKACSV